MVRLVRLGIAFDIDVLAVFAAEFVAIFAWHVATGERMNVPLGFLVAAAAFMALVRFLRQHAEADGGKVLLRMTVRGWAVLVLGSFFFDHMQTLSLPFLTVAAVLSCPLRYLGMKVAQRFSALL